MAPIPMKRSLAEMQIIEGPALDESNDVDYAKEVLQLEGTTEQAVDDALTREAASLGINKSPLLPVAQKAHVSMCDSVATAMSRRARSGSFGSEASVSTSMTSRSSLERHTMGALSMLRTRSSGKNPLSFSEYDRYLAQSEAQEQVAINGLVLPIPSQPAPSLFSVTTRRSYSTVKSNFKRRFRFRKDRDSSTDLNSCVCCREDFKMHKGLKTLPCCHQYCEKCLRILIQQASSDESKMPLKCCGKPIPGITIKSVLSRDEQYIFLKSVLQFSTPWKERIYCPNPSCGEFIPKRHKINPKHPFEVVCKVCRTRACSICKGSAHGIGQDCPADLELEAVLRMGEIQGWRRCYKCRTLVELTQGCSHITCRCKAQFCYLCSAVWDPVVGCPNYCNGEEELERRRQAEEARVAALVAEQAAQEAAELAEAAEALKAIDRSENSEELNALRARQINERDRFNAFQRKVKWLMWTRHGQMKLDLLDRYSDLQVKMKERHDKTATHLEDRQVAAEMELRATLKQSERSVHIRLRHMEAYCDGIGRAASGPNPARVVTERDLRELGQQYNLKNDLERLHQSRINVMREKQGRQMEQLLERQQGELKKLALKQADDLDLQEEIFGLEEEKFVGLFGERRERLKKRWVIVEEMTRRKMETTHGLRYAKLAEIDWPEPEKEIVSEAMSE